MSSCPLLAVVDVGSNSFRLEIARRSGQGFESVHYRKHAVSQSMGLRADGRLTAQAMKAGWHCLADFGRCLRQFEVSHVRAVATQTLRDAVNRQVFLQRGSALLGHPLEVISGEQEAEFMYLGVVSRLSGPQARRLVMDLGGRSTEWALGRGLHPELLTSFPVGSVSWSQAFFPDGLLTEAAFAAAQQAAYDCFWAGRAAFMEAGWEQIYISAGTANAICEILVAHGQPSEQITAADVAWLREKMLACAQVERLQMPGLRAERLPMLAGGVAVLGALFAVLQADCMQRTLGALRTGMLYHLAQQVEAQSSQPG